MPKRPIKETYNFKEPTDRSHPIPVCCSVLQCVAVCCSVLQCVVVCCSVLQCVAGCCSALHLISMSRLNTIHLNFECTNVTTFADLPVCYSVLQSVTGRCRVLQGVTGCYSVL